jgi:nucleotide-binding universal stress UspA family protein
MPAVEPMRLERVLVVHEPGTVDPAPAWELALALARRSGASVTVLGVARPPSTKWIELSGLPPDRLAQLPQEELHEGLAGLARSAPPDIEVRVETTSGVAFAEATRAVLREHYDVVAVPAPPGSVGSTAQHLIRKCPAPVWVVRGAPPSLPARIAVAIDADPEVQHRCFDRKLADTALALAALCESELHVLHGVAPTPSPHTMRYRAGLSEAEVGALLDRLRAKRRQWLEALLGGRTPGPQGCLVRVLDAEPVVEIPAELARLAIDLLVLGTIGRSGLAGFLIGNTAEDMLRRADCSLLALKPDGFLSPVAPA